MATNRLRHFNGCSIEELEPSHLQPRDECPAIDGLSCCSIGTCGHMRPPSKGWFVTPYASAVMGNRRRPFPSAPLRTGLDTFASSGSPVTLSFDWFLLILAGPRR